MKKWRLEAGLMEVLGGNVPMDDFLRQWGKKRLDRIDNVSLRVLDGLSDHETVIEIRAPDVPGILHHLTREISGQGLSIHNARVATWGYEAHDVFYVTDKNGSLVTNSQIHALAAVLGAVMPPL